MAHQDRQKINSWYTDSTYNADELYENSPFATDPRTFPMRASTATSMSYQNHQFAAIPLPSQYQLHTIEEMRNESAEPLPPALKRVVESSVMKNDELVEKSLKSISLIRSRLLQQQEANRKKKCEFQQIRSSLDLVRSLVHLIHDETSNKTFVEFSTGDFKISPNARNFKLLKIEKESATHLNVAPVSDIFEPKTPIRIHPGKGSNSTAKLNSSTRSHKAMSTAANVPTTPTKATRPSIARKAYRQRLEEDLILVSDPALMEKPSLWDNSSHRQHKNQGNYYKNQVKKSYPQNSRH